MTDTAAVRVARGAALLDKHVPDWRQKIDPKRLDIASGEYCILGQTFQAAYDPHSLDDDYAMNAYTFGLVELAKLAGLAAFLGYGRAKGTDNLEVTHGFLEDEEADEYETDEEYDDNVALQAAWRAELAK